MGNIARINAKKEFCANDVIHPYENYYKRALDESRSLLLLLRLPRPAFGLLRPGLSCQDARFLTRSPVLLHP